MELKNKVAVVTGAASGIGHATCKAMIQQGIRAIGAVDRSAAIRDLCEKLNQDAERHVAFAHTGDVADDEFRQRVFSDLRAHLGPVQICIPAAGITKDALAVRKNRDTGRIETYPRRDLEEVFTINLLAPILWAMDAVASVAEDRQRRGLGRWEPAEGAEGCVVFIGSVSAEGNKGQIAYGTSKAGLAGAQATLAKEAIYHGVRCSIIHPGYTDTPMVRSLGEDYIKENILPHTQLRRLLRPAEVADAICFMLRNSAVSGALFVDAGWHPAA